MNHKFAVFILTNRRPDRVITYNTLKRLGYTGKMYLIVDDLDPTIEQYKTNFGSENVIVFDKKAVAKTFDPADNFDDMRAIVYARNASFKIAQDLNLDYFLQLDDDYTSFKIRFDENLKYRPKAARRLDNIFKSFVGFLESTKFSSLCFLQGGDFIGGKDIDEPIRFKRKAMNSFFCSVKKPFQFIGRINEDVNSYTHLASKGYLFGSTNQVSLEQIQTQSNSGGMTELYLDSGTYVKSFYSIIFQPSSVKISVLRDRGRSRIHHLVKWDNTVPKILSDNFKKR